MAFSLLRTKLTRRQTAVRMSTDQPKIEVVDEDAPPALEDANVSDACVCDSVVVE